MMESPPTSLSSPGVSAVNTAAKLQITPEGGLRLVTDKDVLGKEGSANGQQQQQQQQQFFATRTQDGKWNLLMAPTSDPSRLFLVQPAGGQRFQVATSHPAGTTLRAGARKLDVPARRSSAGTSSNGSSREGKQVKEAGHALPQQDSVVIPVPQLRATSTSLTTIAAPRMSGTSASSSSSKPVAVMRMATLPRLAPAAKHMVVAPQYKPSNAARLSLSAGEGNTSSPKSGGSKGSRGCTRLALASSGSRSKVVLVDSATLEKANRKAFGGEMGLTIAVPTSVVQTVPEGFSPEMAGSSTALPVASTTTTTTITAVTTITTSTVTTTTTAATTTSTVVTTSATDVSVIPRSRTPLSVAGCEPDMSSASVSLSRSASPVEKRISQANGGKPATRLIGEADQDRYSLLDNTDNTAECQAMEVAACIEKPPNIATGNPDRAVDAEDEPQPSDCFSTTADVGSMEDGSEVTEAKDSTKPGSSQAKSDDGVVKEGQDTRGIEHVEVVPFAGRKGGGAQNGRTDLCGSRMSKLAVDERGDNCTEKYKGKRKKKRIKEPSEKPLHTRLRERAKTCIDSSNPRRDQAGSMDNPNSEETVSIPAKTLTSGSSEDNAKWTTGDVEDTETANSWEKPEQSTSAFVVLERLNNRDIAFLCRKFRNARVRSRCSSLCRLQTLHYMCSLGLLKCEERLLDTSPRQPSKSLPLPAPGTSVNTVVQDSSTESCSGKSGDELEDDVTKCKRKRMKKRQLKDRSKKKSKTADNPAISKVPSKSSAESTIVTVSTSVHSVSSANPQMNKTCSDPQPITGRFVIAPTFSRSILQVTPTPPVQDTVMPAGSIKVSSTPGSLLPSVSLKQATRNSLSQAISKSLAKNSGHGDPAVGGGDQVSAGLTQVPPILSLVSSSNQQEVFSPYISPSGAKTAPNIRTGTVGGLKVLPALAAKPTLRVPRPIRPPPPLPQPSSTTSLPSSKVIVNSTSTVNKQFYLVQIGDKRLLVPVTTGATTPTSTSAVMTTSTATSSAETSATVSVPACLTSPSSITSVVSKSASAPQSTVVLAASKSGGEGRTAIPPPPPPPPSVRPLSGVPAILQSKTIATLFVGTKPANKAWSGPRTMASGDNRVILVPVRNVPSLVPRGLGLTMAGGASSSSVVRRVNILGAPTGSSSAAALRPVGTTSLLRAVTASSLAHLRPPAMPGTTSGKRPSPMTEAERLAKRARLEKKYPLPPGVVIKTEPESRGYGDEAVVTTASTSNTCIIRIASNASIAGGARPAGGAGGVSAQGIRVDTPIILRSGPLSAQAGQSAILTFVPAVVSSDAAQRTSGSGAAAVTTTTTTSTSSTTTTGLPLQSAATIITSTISSTVTTTATTKSATLQTSVPVTITAVTGLTQSDPLASRASSSSTLLTTLVSPTSSSIPPSTPMTSNSTTSASPPSTDTMPLSTGEPPSSSSVSSRAASPAASESSGMAAQSSTSSPLTVTLPSPSPSPLASLGAMWVRQAAEAPDSLPHIDASSLKGERVRRLRETLAKQLQNLGDERKQRALQALHKQLCVDD